MAKYLSENIKEILTQIKDERIILPAMQRSFVWPAAKIYNLFDSLMRDYPLLEHSYFGKLIKLYFINICLILSYRIILNRKVNFREVLEQLPIFQIMKLFLTDSKGLLHCTLVRVGKSIYI